MAFFHCSLSNALSIAPQNLVLAAFFTLLQLLGRIFSLFLIDVYFFHFSPRPVALPSRSADLDIHRATDPASRCFFYAPTATRTYLFPVSHRRPLRPLFTSSRGPTSVTTFDSSVGRAEDCS